MNNLRHERIKQKYVEGFVEEPSESFLENVIKAELFEMLHRIFELNYLLLVKKYTSSVWRGKNTKQTAKQLHISIKAR